MPDADWVQEFAPGKINLTLHVTGRRGDGYHLLDSLVVFAGVGDTVRMRRAEKTSLTISGRYLQGIPSDASNLVWRAVDWFGTPPVEIELIKELPASSGIGGGSSDAAATLRAMSKLWKTSMPKAASLVGLGADIPVCIAAQATRMSGVGEVLARLPELPPIYLVLVNPMREVSTPEVFKALPSKVNAPMPDRLPEWSDTKSFATWLATQRNDLELPARASCPAVGVVLARLEQTEGCLLARMSGSGATCFGIYASLPQAQFAADAISKAHPDWWVVATTAS